MFIDSHLSDTDRKAIHDFALDARDLLVSESRDMLEGMYGLKADGKLAPTSRLPNLANDPESQETHARLGRLLDDEVNGGLERREAVDKLVKEVAFTHLNRLVAFKMMEARKLIRQAVSRGKESNGFKFFLADHPDEEERWNSGSRGADVAYRHFLLWQSEQVAREVRVLFDTDNLASRLFPRPTALDRLLKLLNAEALASAWRSPETIGWIYQYFNEREKSDVFERLYKKKQKIRREDIPAATQLFTPRWIVRFLVENTLGRMWVQMHPDSRLKAELRYLVPLEGEIPVEPLKPAKEITLLDPACGTMHFGLVAFDLFAEMYREEIERAGQAGWLAQASVAGEREIPAAIIANNLFGIDIDLRAVQLSALTLYLKAKELDKDAAITDSNLACADVLALNGERLNAFVREMNFNKPAYERMIRALWARLKDINQLGSLLRLEEEIAGLVKQERELYDREGRQPDLFGERARFEGEAAQEEYWDIVEAQLVQAFDEFARRAAQRGSDETLFAGEAVKGLRVLDLMLRRYDCVVTNPPYMGKRNMISALAGLIAESYPNADGDFYTAFLKRNCEFLKPQGRLGMLTIHSFMFISSYERLRAELADVVAIEAICHLGPRTMMDLSNPNAQGFVMFTFRSEPSTSTRSRSQGTYLRLVSYDDKVLAFENALRDRRDTFVVAQSRFDSIEGFPWVYWISDSIRSLFRELPPLREIAAPRQGLHTGDNPRFLRMWWELGITGIGFGYKERAVARNSDKRWFPYMKGGMYRKWYGNQEFVLNWYNDGREIRNLIRDGRLASRPQNADFYFKEGATYTSQTVSDLNLRYLPVGFIFDFSGSCIFPTTLTTSKMLAILNSSFAAFVLRILNPTVSFETGDLARVPMPKSTSKQLDTLVGRCVSLRKSESKQLETAFEFVIPPLWSTSAIALEACSLRLAEVEEQIDDEVYRLYDISAEDRVAIEAELRGSLTADTDDENGSNDENTDVEETNTQQAARITNEELAVRWISYAVGIILGRFQPGIAGSLGSAVYRPEDFAIGSLPAPSEEEFNELVGAPAKFAYVDSNGGRHVFSANVEKKLCALADNDGIVVLDEGHPDDLPRKVEIALTLMLGEQGTEEVAVEIGGDLRRFLERDFFPKWHVKWYQKRPIYWLLQSPRKMYGLYLFHERMTKDTLFVIQRRYLDPKINLTKQLLTEKRAAAKAASEARERRELAKDADEIEKLLVDLEEFAKHLKAITDRGYDPDIDDGVILNLAPLASVIPAWRMEPQKYWDALEHGDYDWARIAMKYWPQRVKRKCKTDKSLAIAHGLA
ncbi:MAG: BREX-1 system adenine-specific DNA-methyltransferase PglX [Chloroflexi bacterium]|nr:BREX-1 system adenine-specific DNA-methyltransferase PglX [Chloroflexota bacterium]